MSLKGVWLNLLVGCPCSFYDCKTTRRQCTFVYTQARQLVKLEFRCLKLNDAIKLLTDKEIEDKIIKQPCTASLL